MCLQWADSIHHQKPRVMMHYDHPGTLSTDEVPPAEKNVDFVCWRQVR